MPKQQTAQRYIFKISTSRLKRAKWDLTLSLAEARKNDEIVSLNDSQMLRWIDELNGLEDVEEESSRIKQTIKKLRREPNSVKNRHEIKKLYAKLDEVQFKPDYMCLVIDKVKDYQRACKGFSINGIKYTRLLGTNGGVKLKTIVFVSERLAPELRKRIDNGRNQSIPLIPAKFEAYRALTCSGSQPVSMPNGILVVKDCETEFYEDVITLDDEDGGEPKMELKENEKIVLDESDGYGLIHPRLAQRWADELGLDYLPSGFNTRFSWEKGMVFTFDFWEFAGTVAKKKTVTDAWGNEVNIGDVELVLTTSQLKLWDSYDSIEQYLRCCEENHYTFGVTKVCPYELEDERDTNYQFLQGYDLSDEDIEELIRPTIDTIKDVLSDDWRKAVIYLEGSTLNKKKIYKLPHDYAKAIMIDSRVYNDPFVKKRLTKLIQKRIDDAKIGVIKVHGNYSMVSGDPYSLCQSIFGLPVTGLLKKGEIYNKYWIDENAEKVACFRAPMSCPNNIKLLQLSYSDEAAYWYRFMTTCTVLNSWDSTAQALNGCDKDGDLVFLTNNPVIVRNTKELPTIMCAQRKADKTIITEEALIQANINSFGDDIGKTTNRITTMFNVKAGFDKDSEEYKTLEYRIMCGQLYQQNCIDKVKGIVAKPMPKEWYDRMTAWNTEYEGDDTEAKKEFNQRIVADKKPYFMRYIYPEVMKDYNTYMTNTRKKCMREYRIPLEELLAKPEEELSESEAQFVKYYKLKIPVGMNDCVMNKICKRFEEEFDNYFTKNETGEDFDYTIMKSEIQYTTAQYNAIKKIHEQYLQRLQNYEKAKTSFVRFDDNKEGYKIIMMNDFSAQCSVACSNSSLLCNIILDLCYKREGTKQFAWDMCGESIIENLLNKNGRLINYPELDSSGDVAFGGKRFTFKTKEIEETCVQ